MGDEVGGERTGIRLESLGSSFIRFSFCHHLEIKCY